MLFHEKSMAYCLYNFYSILYPSIISMTAAKLISFRKNRALVGNIGDEVLRGGDRIVVTWEWRKTFDSLHSELHEKTDGRIHTELEALSSTLMLYTARGPTNNKSRKKNQWDVLFYGRVKINKVDIAKLPRNSRNARVIQDHAIHPSVQL